MSRLEESLALQLVANGISFEREVKAIEGRRFRFDFCLAGRLLIEVQGGTFARGKMGHTSGMGIHRDYEKANLATLAGWRVLSVAEHHIKSGQAIAWIREAMAGVFHEPLPGPDSTL